MTVEELIQLLERFDPDAEVKIASQASEPIAYDIEYVVDTWDISVEDEEDLKEIEEGPMVVYVVPGNEVGQAPSEIWDSV